jgi:uncharacterized protein YqfA (UPF0365 family)
METIIKHQRLRIGSAIGFLIILTSGCNSMKEPSISEVAVSKSVVENAAAAGGPQFAPVEMKAAREKLALANQSLANRDYKAALELASQAEADAKLAQSKANSAKAEAAAKALQEDIRVLREELNRGNK